MARIDLKLTTIKEALETLSRSITLFDQYNNSYVTSKTRAHEELMLMARDSMIQRFEYCTDLFWKLLKIYLTDVEKIALETNSPRGVIRATVHAKIISEQQGKACMDMVECRNKTSHIYHTELAEAIAKQIPEFYELLTTIVEYIATRTNNKK